MGPRGYWLPYWTAHGLSGCDSRLMSWKSGAAITLLCDPRQAAGSLWIMLLSLRIGERLIPSPPNLKGKVRSTKGKILARKWPQKPKCYSNAEARISVVITEVIATRQRSDRPSWPSEPTEPSYLARRQGPRQPAASGETSSGWVSPWWPSGQRWGAEERSPSPALEDTGWRLRRTWGGRGTGGLAEDAPPSSRHVWVGNAFSSASGGAGIAPALILPGPRGRGLAITEELFPGLSASYWPPGESGSALYPTPACRSQQGAAQEVKQWLSGRREPTHPLTSDSSLCRAVPGFGELILSSSSNWGTPSPATPPHCRGWWW